MDTTPRVGACDAGLDAPPRYELGRRLGSGAAAVVSEAHDRVLDRRVAVKVFREVSATPYETRRREQEVRHLVDARHPGVVELFDRFVDDRGRDVLVFEAMQDTLAAPTPRSRRGPLPALTRAGRQAAAAVAHLHALGIVHRDLKPANILTSGSGPAQLVKLADFGLAAYVDERELPIAGSIEFMAPEQIDGAPASFASDVYALGLTLLQTYTGRPAYTGTTLEIAIQRTVRPAAVPAALPRTLRRALLSATAIDPVDRLSAAELAERFALQAH
ncbi:serine/threonine protein kinase [Microbacteriaceae bacterium VKM Ac-2854]|nr:serine/threonine protein kinase [Microbacteriaceae bacterium VKM Ac-2854]